MSVAVFPATAEGLLSPSPAEVTMADHDMPCCPACNTQDDFKGSTCILKCAGLAAVVLPMMIFKHPYIAQRSTQALEDEALHGLARAPPTHPPRA